MAVNKIVLSWHDGQQKWAATCQSPRGKALASSPKIAVNRLKRSLEQRQSDAEFEVVVQLPSGAQAAVDRYLAALAESAEKQEKALNMQVELAELFIEKYGFNRSQAAAAVGLSHAHLGAILDRKVLRSVALPTIVNPSETIADFVNTPASDRQPVKRNNKKR